MENQNPYQPSGSTTVAAPSSGGVSNDLNQSTLQQIPVAEPMGVSGTTPPQPVEVGQNSLETSSAPAQSVQTGQIAPLQGGDSLEQASTNDTTTVAQPAMPDNVSPEAPAKQRENKQQKRRISKALIGITAGALAVVLLVAGISTYIARRNSTNLQASTDAIAEQEVNIGEQTEDKLAVLGLQGDFRKLVVNGDLVATGALYVSSSDSEFFTKLTAEGLTVNRTITLPDASGTVCLDNNNCNFAADANYLVAGDFVETSIEGITGDLLLGSGLAVQGSTIINTAASFTETTVNNFAGSVAIQGTGSQISVTSSNGTITLSTPQDIATTSSPTFNTITLSAVGTQNGNVICDISNNCGYSGGTNGFVQDGNSFGETATLGTNDAESLVLETNNQSAVTIASGGAVTFQNAVDSTAALRVNRSSGDAIFTVVTSGLVPGIYLGNDTAPIPGIVAFHDGTIGNNFAVAFTGASAYTGNHQIIVPDEAGTLCLQGSSDCGFTTGSGEAFVQNGNSFGGTATLGTNDANDLVFETDDTARMIISAANGHIGLGNTNGITGPVVDSCTSTQVTYLGISDCSSIIHIQELVTNNREHIAGINNSLQISSSFDFSNSLIYGSSNLVVTDAGSTNDYGLIVGSTNVVNHNGDGLLSVGGGGEFLFENTGAGSVDSGYGINVEARNSGAGNVSSLQGASITAVSTNGTVDDLTGIDLSVTAGGTVTSATGLSVRSRARVNGNVTTNIGVDVVTGNLSGDGGGDNNSITDNYGVRIQSAQNGDGTIDNNYGLYIQDQSNIASTDNYNIYSAGSGYNWFQGHTAIGNIGDTLLANAVLSVGESTSTPGIGLANALQVNASGSNSTSFGLLNELNTIGVEDYDTSTAFASTLRNTSSGITDSALAIGAQLVNDGTGTITDGYGISIATTENSGGGTIINNYGLYIQDQSGIGSTGNYNIYSAGSGRNYFAGAVELGTLFAADNATFLCRSSTNIIAACNTTGTGAAFVQGGNSFGATATLGTNDSNSIALKTNNATQATIAVGGATLFKNTVDSTTAFQVQSLGSTTPVLNVDTANGRIGIGTAAPSAKLDIQASSSSSTAGTDYAQNITVADTGAVLSGTDETRALSISVTRSGAGGTATVDTRGLSVGVFSDAGGTSTASGAVILAGGADSNYGLTAAAMLTGNTASTTSIGVNGSVNTLIGLGASSTTAFGLQGQVGIDNGTATYTTAAGLNIATATNTSGGTITSNYGIKVEAQTAGVSDYGIRIDAADTQTLWISGNANNTTAAAGIAFGASRDTNLYRSAADTLKTDDNLDVASKLQVGGNSSFTQCSTIIGLSSCTKSFEQVLASTDTTTATWGANFATGINPSAATNTQSNRAVNALLGLYGTQSFSGSNRAIYGSATNASTAGTIALLGGVFGEVQQLGTGSTVTEAVGIGAQISQSNGTLTTGYGMRVLTATGTIGTNYGIHVQTQTAGTTDYGIRIDAADTQTLWISGNADNTTAAAGIAFGSSRDTNLYRSAADTLRTDDSVEIGAKLQIGANGGTLSQCSSTLGLFTCNNNFEQAYATTETSIQSYGANFVTGITPGATNTVENRAINANLALFGSQSFSSASGNYAINGLTINATTAGTVTLIGGVAGTATQAGTGSTVTEAFGVQGAVNHSNGTLTTGYGMRVLTATGTIGTNYGIHVQTQTAGTTDYGIRIDAADTQTLWISGNADNTTAAAGIAFGSSRDTNLYRSAADTLKTDDSLHVTNSVGIGVAPGSYKLDVNTDAASYVANFFNDGNNQNRSGIRIQAGADDASGTTYYLDAYDGDGGQVGYIANTSGTFAVTDVSDIRTKTNIVDSNVDALDVLTGLRVVDFNRLQNPNGPQITGFIAQEVQDVYSQAVTTGANGYLGVMKDAFIPVLVKGVQQQQAQISTLSSSNTDLQAQIDDLRAQVNGINTTSGQGNGFATLNVSGTATIQTLTVSGSISAGSLTVAGNATVGGNLRVDGHIIGNEDTRGVITVPAGETEFEYTFETPYAASSEPIVNLTPTNTFAPNYRVEATDEGFTVYFETPATTSVKLNYQVQQ